MFAPVGYCSFLKAAKLVGTFYDEWGPNFDPLFAATFEWNDGELSAHLAKVFSKREILERTFFQLVNEFELFVCSGEGELYNLDIPLHLNFVQLSQLASDPLIDNRYFEEEIDWPSYEKEINDNLAAGKDPWSATFYKFPHTSLNLFYSRDTFLIDDSECSALNRCSSGLFLPEYYGYRFSREDVRKFSGWSLCLKEEDAASITKEQLKETFFKIIFEAAFGADSYNELQIPQLGQAKVGRPPKRQAAAEAFLRHFSWDDKPNWKLVQRILLEKEGIDVSPKTIKRGLDDMKGGDK